jgi:hypothetical protein
MTQVSAARLARRQYGAKLAGRRRKQQETTMSKTRQVALGLAMGLALSGGVFLAAPTAMAQDAASMSCGELWHARNAIYARNGYCFKTARARAVFGAGCFPPYGEMSGAEKRRVDELQYWERRNGC